MYSHMVYVVATTERGRDVHIINVYDGDVYTADSIVDGLRDKLKGNRYQVSMLGDNAYIDIIDSNNELVKTYSIIRKVAMLVKD